MGDKPLKETQTKIDVALVIIERAITNSDLRDEIYCQLAKQITFNPNEESTHRGWELMTLCVNYFPPSKELHEDIMSFFMEHLKFEEDQSIPSFSKYCLRKLPKTQNEGARGRIPNSEELEGLLIAPFKQAIFGSTLIEVMEIQKEFAPEEEMPLVLTRLCKKVLELNGHKTEGIFRVPGDTEQVAALRIRIENGQYDWDDIIDPHVPASLLKFWMRELEEPIIPGNLYDEAIDSARNDEEEKSRDLIKQLPDINKTVVEYVIQYLKAMADPDFVPITKMSVTNLSMVFAPNFLRCPSADPSVILDTQKYQQNFVKHLIEGANFNQQYSFFDKL